MQIAPLIENMFGPSRLMPQNNNHNNNNNNNNNNVQSKSTESSSSRATYHGGKDALILKDLIFFNETAPIDKICAKFESHLTDSNIKFTSKTVQSLNEYIKSTMERKSSQINLSPDVESLLGNQFTFAVTIHLRHPSF
jgi:hypothetical protein